MGFEAIQEKNNAPADWLLGRPNFLASIDYMANLARTDTANYWHFPITTVGNT